MMTDLGYKPDTTVNEPHKGHHLALGVTGGIGAYKAALLVRHFSRAGVKCSVIMTRNATRFITPLTFQTLTGNRVIVDQFEDANREWDVGHVSLAKSADSLLVAPATANILGKFAHGIADDFLSTFYTAFEKPVFVAPAMNTAMFTHPAVQSNIDTLLDRGVRVINPDSGFLACGDRGLGRLADPHRIVETVLTVIDAQRSSALKNLRILITAGPTREAVDPVRFLSNRSSGKMGYALADEAVRRGAQVVLVSGPTQIPSPDGCEILCVESCDEMAAAVNSRYDEADVVIMAAAPSDYRPAVAFAEKRHKTDDETEIQLERTTDILSGLGKRKGDRILVGFAAETDDDPEVSARSKLKRKNLDLIVANRVGVAETGFECDTNAGSVIDCEGRTTHIGLTSKSLMAAKILNIISAYHEERNTN